MVNWYDLLQVIDEGGQATIRLVRKRSSGELLVGKFLREHWDPIARENFRAEGLRQARLVGPGVVPIYDYNFTADQPFIVLEYMPRGSFAKELALRGKLPLLEALRTAQEIASLLSHLHAKHVIHRDLKPGNVLRGKDGRLLLNDFGLGATISAGEYVTAGGFVGTPRYASPEQHANYATPASDLYALGVMLAEMVTGNSALVGMRAPAEAVEIIARLTKADPRQRPDAYTTYHLIESKIKTVEMRMRKRQAEMNRVVGQVTLAGIAVGLLVAFSK